MTKEKNKQTQINEQIKVLDRLSKQENPSEFKRYIANSSSYLLSLGLVMYADSKKNLFSYIYESMNTSLFDNEIILHPGQLRVIKKLEKGNVFLSAPTSFGKSYLILEYIATHVPSKIIIIVPTLALIDEYQRNLKKLNISLPFDYEIFNSIDFEEDENIPEKSIFLLTHEKAANHLKWRKFNERVDIDFSIIDEIHKINKRSFYKEKKKDELIKQQKDKEIIISKSFWNIITNSKKYILIGPNINAVNFNEENHNMQFVKENFKPVYNDYENILMPSAKDRTDFINNFILNDPTKKLVYFPGPGPMLSYIRENKESLMEVNNNFDEETQKNISSLLRWIEENIHRDWYIYDLLKKGIMVHHGSIPTRVREKIVSLFESGSVNTILITSTMIDGVNTSTEKLLITSSTISRSKMKPFEIANLVGRTGRTKKHFVGKTIHLLKSDNDTKYDLENSEMDLEISIFNDNFREDLQTSLGSLSDAHRNVIREFNLSISDEEYLDRFSSIGIEKMRQIIQGTLNIEQKLSLKSLQEDHIKKITDRLFELKIISLDLITKTVISFLMNENSLKVNIGSYILWAQTKKIKKENFNQHVDGIIKLYNGTLENSQYIDLMTSYNLMPYLNVSKKYIDEFFVRILIPIEKKFHLNDEPVFKTMHSYGIPKWIIEKSKKDNYFKDNLKLRNKDKIIKILVSNGISIDEI